MYGIYANIWGILMVHVTIYGIHGSYGLLNIVNSAFYSEYSDREFPNDGMTIEVHPAMTGENNAHPIHRPC